MPPGLQNPLKIQKSKDSGKSRKIREFPYIPYSCGVATTWPITLVLEPWPDCSRAPGNGSAPNIAGIDGGVERVHGDVCVVVNWKSYLVAVPKADEYSRIAIKGCESLPSCCL